MESHGFGWQNKGILGILWKNYSNNPQRVAIGVGEKKITYEQLVNKGTRIAAGLYELGVRKGDRVGMLTPNGCNWYTFLYGLLRVGAIAVPFDPQMGEYEIRYLFDKIGIRVILVPLRYRGIDHSTLIRSLANELPDLQHIIVDGECEQTDNVSAFSRLLAADHESIQDYSFSLEPDDSNIFFCTTGSTGNPKIVDISTRYINDNFVKNATHWGFEDNDRFFLAMPLYHCAGFGWGLSCLSNGGSTYYDEAFSPTRLLEIIQNEGITKILLTPTLATILLTHPRLGDYDISSLNQIVFTGEYLADELAAVFTDEMGINVINALGMTETFVYLDWDARRDKDVSPDYLGQIPGTEVRVVKPDGSLCAVDEKGILHVKNSFMKKYFRLPIVTEQTITPDGWLNTGDIGEVESGNRIRFVGRDKRVIKRGGNLVSPEEIEQFIRTYPNCVGVIVMSETDEMIGEKIIAYIQLAEEGDTSKNDVLKFCKGKISTYKIPDEIKFVREIPTTVGKANPTVLKKMLQEHLL